MNTAEEEGIHMWLDLPCQNLNSMIGDSRISTANQLHFRLFPFKQQKLILTAQYYLLQNPELKDFNMRFDVVEVFYSGGYDCTINRIENAFSL